MRIEGYMKIQPNGRYRLFGEEGSCELTCGDCLEVRIEDSWVTMRLEHDGERYYLLNDGLSFYPKRVYARLNDNVTRF